MGMVDKQAIFTKNIAKLIVKAGKLGIELTFGHAWRSKQEQARMFQLGKSKVQYGQHQKRLAVDFNFFIDGKLIYRPFSHQRDELGRMIKTPNAIQKLGDYWENLHPDNRWGGNWKTFVDTPHFEMKG